jgi:competence protein CoiA
MPLKCLQDGNSVYAFDFSGADWEALKEQNRKLRHLQMSCCGARATPKTSKLGTQFFAHAKVDGCATPAETAEHLLAKVMVAEAVKAAGWQVDTEVSGCTPSGEQWIADVMATKGRARIAVEIQWSRQSQEETRRRQERYRQSGVRGLWLMQHPTLLREEETPTFLLRYNERSREFSVQIPSGRFRPEFMGNRIKDEPMYWQHNVALREFLIGSLSGRLRFAPAIGSRLAVTVFTAPVQCWKCKKVTRSILSLEFGVDRLFRGHSKLSMKIYDFDEIEGCEDFLDDVFSRERLQRHGIGTIMRRYSKTEKLSYLSNGCVHCDALQGRSFDHAHWYEAKPTYSIEAELSDRWACQLFNAYDNIMLWWFAESDKVVEHPDLATAR